MSVSLKDCALWNPQGALWLSPALGNLGKVLNGKPTKVQYSNNSSGMIVEEDVLRNDNRLTLSGMVGILATTPEYLRCRLGNPLLPINPINPIRWKEFTGYD